MVGCPHCRQTEPAGDDHALDLGRALADLQDLGVAVEPRDGVLLHEAIAAEDLRGDCALRVTADSVA